MVVSGKKIPSSVTRKKILYQAAKSFLEVGYKNTRLTDLASKANINMGSLINCYRHKEDILLDLVEYVLGGQFAVSAEMIDAECDEPAFLYMVDTALELHIAESSENIQDLYVSVYTIAQTASRIHELMTPRIEQCFARYNPRLRTRDFYQMEIGSAALMRGYISAPCDEAMTVHEKVQRFHEATLRMYRVPPGTIRQLMQKIAGYDFAAIAEQTVQQMQERLRVPSENRNSDSNAFE